MYLSLYTGLLSIFYYICIIILLLLLSKYLTYPFVLYTMVLEKALLLCIYPMKYLNELLLPCECLVDNTILLISALLILIGLEFLLIQSWPNSKAFFVSFLYHPRKKNYAFF